MIVAAALFTLLAGVAAQDRPDFMGHLSPLPANARESVTMQGKGRVTASLDGTTLVIQATFEGLNSPAAAAAIRRAIPGMRGDVQFPLTVTRGTNGSIAAKLTLTPAQMAEVKRGWYYIQIDTEKNPEGHIRGWLLPKE